MTLSDLLSLARDIAPADIHPQFANDPEVRLARAVLDLLGASQPCGWPEPRVTNDGFVDIGATFEIGRVLEDPDGVRALCAMLLRCADEAEGRK